MTTTTTPNEDLGHDLVITKATCRTAGAGTWECGTLAGHHFDALVFPEHADDPDWEIGDSRISKLWVQRLTDRQTVYNWDRGLDVPAANATAQAIVEFLGAGLSRSSSFTIPFLNAARSGMHRANWLIARAGSADGTWIPW